MNVVEMLELERASYARAREVAGKARALVIAGLQLVFGYDLVPDSVYTHLEDDSPGRVHATFNIEGYCDDIVMLLPAHATTCPEDIADWMIANVPSANNPREFCRLAQLETLVQRRKSYQDYLAEVENEMAALHRMGGTTHDTSNQ